MHCLLASPYPGIPGHAVRPGEQSAQQGRQSEVARNLREAFGGSRVAKDNKALREPIQRLAAATGVRLEAEVAHNEARTMAA